MVKFISYQILFIVNCLLILPYSMSLFAVVSIALVALVIIAIMQIKSDNRRLATTFYNGLQSLNDGDFSISLSSEGNKAFSHEIHFFNSVIDKLRKERQHLFQRELLLDKVVNASNVVTLLFNHRSELVFVNQAAQSFYHHRRDLLGSQLETLCQDGYQSLSTPFSDAKEAAQDAIIYLPDQQQLEQAWHLSSTNLTLHSVSHTLILIKPINDQLNKQELLTWKKVIRVINHELNNSIAPVSSLCHSGQMLATQLGNPQLERVFNGISKRVNHLGQFIKDYSELAKIKLPNKTAINSDELIRNISTLFDIQIDNQLANTTIYGDKEQLEQVLINLVKNASQAEQVSQIKLSLTQQNETLCLKVSDNGLGMTSEVMQQAFTPYFSTKQEGSGIGLAICREIIEAHQGRIQLNNNNSDSNRGFTVSIYLPK